MDFTQPDTADLDSFSMKESFLRIKYKNTSNTQKRSTSEQNKYQNYRFTVRALLGSKVVTCSLRLVHIA